MTAAGTRARPTSEISLHVGAPGSTVATEAAALLNESLGSGFIRPSDLAELTAGRGGVLIRARNRPGQLLGSATARLLDQDDVNALRDRMGSAGVVASLDGHQVGELKSIVVAPAARGMGLGTIMLAAAAMWCPRPGSRPIHSNLLWGCWKGPDSRRWPPFPPSGRTTRRRPVTSALSAAPSASARPSSWSSHSRTGLSVCRRAAGRSGVNAEQGLAAARALPWPGPWCREVPAGRGARRV